MDTLFKNIYRWLISLFINNNDNNDNNYDDDNIYISLMYFKD